MTNTKFRRRALISSLAMLLVALVALGSATFAWFTSNPTANAKGIVGKGQTSTGLEITTDTDPTPTDKHAAKFFNNNTDFIMEPAYMSTVGSFFQAKAINSYTSTADGDINWTEVAVNSTTTPVQGVYHEAAHLKTKGSTTSQTVYLTGLKINNTQNAMNGAVTVAVAQGGQLKATFKVTSANTILGFTTPSTSTKPVLDSSKNVTPTAPSNEGTLGIALGNLASDSATLDVDFYVYLDGTDTSVVTDSAHANQLLTGIEAYFSTQDPTA